MSIEQMSSIVQTNVNLNRYSLRSGGTVKNREGGEGLQVVAHILKLLRVKFAVAFSSMPQPRTLRVNVGAIGVSLKLKPVSRVPGGGLFASGDSDLPRLHGHGVFITRQGSSRYKVGVGSVISGAAVGKKGGCFRAGRPVITRRIRA